MLWKNHYKNPGQPEKKYYEQSNKYYGAPNMTNITDLLMNLFEKQFNCEIKNRNDWELRKLVIGYQDKGKTLPESLQKWMNNLDNRHTRYFYRICRKENIYPPEALLLRLDQLLKDDEHRYMLKKDIQTTMEQSEPQHTNWAEDDYNIYRKTEFFLHVWNNTVNLKMRQKEAVKAYWKQTGIEPDIKVMSKVKQYQILKKESETLIDFAKKARDKNPNNWIESILLGLGES